MREDVHCVHTSGSIQWDEMSSRCSYLYIHSAVCGDATRRAVFARSSPRSLCSQRPPLCPHKFGKCKSAELKFPTFAPRNVLFVFALTAGLWSRFPSHVLNNQPLVPNRNTQTVLWRASGDAEVRAESGGRKIAVGLCQGLSLFGSKCLCVFKELLLFSLHLLNQTRMGGAVIALHSYSTSKWHKEQCINCVIWIQFSAVQSKNAPLNESTLFCGTQQFAAADAQPEWASPSLFFCTFAIAAALKALRFTLKCSVSFQSSCLLGTF